MTKITNDEILKIAMQQSAVDSNCNVDDLIGWENWVKLTVKPKDFIDTMNK